MKRRIDLDLFIPYFIVLPKEKMQQLLASFLTFQLVVYAILFSPLIRLKNIHG